MRRRSIALGAALLTVLAGSVSGEPVHAQPAASASWTLAGQSLNIAGGSSVSSGFRLVSCLEYAPGGAAASSGYRVQSGCGFALQFQAGIPAHVAVSGGGSQSTLVLTPFPRPLQVTVTDDLGAPVAGLTVVFTAPGAGASAVLSGGGVASTDVGGIASVTATANGIGGSYLVSATASTLAPVTFALANVEPIPVLGTAGVLLLLVLLAGLGVLMLRRAG
jgi:hypothetical protein